MRVPDHLLTPWFSPSVKPHHIGEYQAKYTTDDTNPHMRFWDGMSWRFAVQKTVCGNQFVPWRGMAQEQPDDEMWVQANGVAIPVGEMDEHHVRSALRMLLRRKRLCPSIEEQLADSFAKTRAGYAIGGLIRPDTTSTRRRF